MRGDIGELERLLARVDVRSALETRDNEGCTAATLAAEHDQPGCLRALLAAGANKDALDNNGTSALMLASL